jgi:hypothetical protein
MHQEGRNLKNHAILLGLLWKHGNTKPIKGLSGVKLFHITLMATQSTIPLLNHVNYDTEDIWIWVSVFFLQKSLKWDFLTLTYMGI